LLYQFVDTEQKYQINPQLFLWTGGLLCTALLYQQPASSANRLANVIVQASLGFNGQWSDAPANGDGPYARELEH
jgi:hypothetical protein